MSGDSLSKQPVVNDPDATSNGDDLFQREENNDGVFVIKLLSCESV